MSNYWTPERIEKARAFAVSLSDDARSKSTPFNPRASYMEASNEIILVADEIERLQAENAALKAAPHGDMVLVPRELVECIADYCVGFKVPCAAILQACLDAPPVRVVEPGDVVIPAVVMTGIKIEAGDGWLKLHCVADESLDALAAKLTGETTAG